MLLLKTSLYMSIGISAHFPGNTEENLFASTGRHWLVADTVRTGIFWIWLILGNSTLQPFTSYSCSVYNLCSPSAATSKNVKPSNIFTSLYCTVFSVPWLSKCFCYQNGSSSPVAMATPSDLFHNFSHGRQNSWIKYDECLKCSTIKRAKCSCESTHRPSSHPDWQIL